MEGRLAEKTHRQRGRLHRQRRNDAVVGVQLLDFFLICRRKLVTILIFRHGQPIGGKAIQRVVGGKLHDLSRKARTAPNPAFEYLNFILRKLHFAARWHVFLVIEGQMGHFQKQSQIGLRSVPGCTILAAFGEQFGGGHDEFTLGFLRVVATHAFFFQNGLHHVGVHQRIVHCHQQSLIVGSQRCQQKLLAVRDVCPQMPGGQQHDHRQAGQYFGRQKVLGQPISESVPAKTDESRSDARPFVPIQGFGVVTRLLGKQKAQRGRQGSRECSQ